LRSVVLYGSAARGDHTGKSSDLNVMVEVQEGDPERLLPAAPVQQRWEREGNRPLLFVTQEWIRGSTDVFPLEFLDMLDAHKILFGEDPLAGVEVSGANLRRQCEHEIRSIVLKLRAAYLDAHGKARHLYDLLAASFGSVATVARAALRLAGDQVPAHSDAVFEAVAGRFGLDAEPFRQVAGLKKAGSPEALERMRTTFLAYFAQIAALGRALDAMTPGSGTVRSGGARVPSTGDEQ
jgi:hypothetical protein